jgi:molybdopterin synthase catalytic subunit
MITTTGLHDGPLTDCAATGLCVAHHGAVASFLGVVRNTHHGKAVTGLTYSAYRAMAEALLIRLAAEARAAHGSDLDVVCLHGLGAMVPGDVSLVIHVGSAHRDAAFDACRLLLTRIKQDLPVWKHEHYGDGTSAWLEGS